MPSTKPIETHFRTIQNFEANYAPAKFTLYDSGRTGMRVVVVDRQGPKVHGYFALATEIHDDSGAPHTLEHLCFMGSRNYKYKGVLDQLATRAYSNTNAWTATDHTAYTLDTAGWEGFGQILPIYLDHILLPTLTDSACYTEVYHVNGKGHDAGVVYSEMQGVQNTQGELMELQARRLMYPEGVGFRYETGGMMENLRVLTADRIRDFHREMYQPKNLCLVIVGEVNHTELLHILDNFEESILDLVPPPDAPFKRPWVDSKPAPPLTKTIVDRVEFPEEDESFGEILIGFFGPPCTDSLLDSAMNVILSYLAESSASVLVNTLVEKEQLASGIYHSIDMRPNTVVWFTISGVSTEHLAQVEQRFFEVLKETSTNALDMDYLKECLHRFRRQIVFATESSHSVFADPIIEDHLFGNRDGSTLIESLGSLKALDVLAGWDEGQWKVFLKKWLADAHHVSILGVPSAKLSKKLKKDEKERVKAQQDRLGKEGLERLAHQLEKAKADNDKDIPQEILEQFAIPGIDSIHFFPTTTVRAGLAKSLGRSNNELQDLVDKDESGLPLFIHFEHIPTNFVHLNLVLCTRSIPLHLKPLLVIYIANFFNCPMLLDGKRLEFEEVVTKLEKDTILYDIDNGSAVGNPELLRIKMVIEPEKYEIAIKWLRDLLLYGIFDEQRLKTSVKKMLADIPDEKRSGNGMAYAVDTMVHYASSSSARAQNTLVKAIYLRRILRVLNRDPKQVIDRLEALRHTLVRFSNMRSFVIADLRKLTGPASSWKHLVSMLDVNEPLNPVDSRKDILSDAAREPGKLAYVVPMPPIDSSYLLLTGKGIGSYSHPKLPALMVALAYLDAVEGPLWTAVRGTGLAYGTSFSRNADTGILGFRVYRSPDAFKAYTVARSVVEEFISGTRKLEKHALEGAISSIVVGFADEQATMAAAATLGFANLVIRGIDKKWNDEMLKKVREVKEAEIRSVLEEIVLPVFLPGKANLVVTCASLMEEALKTSFESAGFRPEVKPLSFFQDDYGLEAGDEPEDQEDEDEDDGSGEDHSDDGESDGEGDETESSEGGENPTDDESDDSRV